MWYIYKHSNIDTFGWRWRRKLCAFNLSSAERFISFQKRCASITFSLPKKNREHFIEYHTRLCCVMQLKIEIHIPTNSTCTWMRWMANQTIEQKLMMFTSDERFLMHWPNLWSFCFWHFPIDTDRCRYLCCCCCCCWCDCGFLANIDHNSIDLFNRHRRRRRRKNQFGTNWLPFRFVTRLIPHSSFFYHLPFSLYYCGVRWHEMSMLTCVHIYNHWYGSARAHKRI